MRLSASFVVPSLLGLAAAAAPQPRIFVRDFGTPTRPNTQSTPTLSPDTARLVFAQRLGLSQYHSLKHADDDTIQHINDFGSPRHQLLDDDELEPKQFMVVVEGVKDTAVLDSTSFFLSEIPSVDATSRLLEDFTLQAERLSLSPMDRSVDPLPEPIKDVLAKIPEDIEPRLFGDVLILHIRNEDENDYSSTIRELVKLVSGRWALTVAMMPPSSSNFLKRSPSTWGQYDVPKRSATADRKRPEAILSEAQESDFYERVNKTTVPKKAPTSPNNATVRGILPACFPSKDSCESSTKACSGRGQCIKKYMDTDNNKACYTCRCEAQVRTNKDGSKKTTYYGGPACQKKDVVMPFWLFTGFAVAMAFMLSYGIGLLYTMGNEELPSVIGAGVSGPSARR
ncbi:uncharacterized protein BKCO1_1900016 [Diplodia corticola]|uniref:Conserved fungal protein n=1 Tax=Diplodia corticola TaxID=236234 RepID=A0A1J9S675_9PEZI|nr:uncharacterized protein BKCO1_1900016 [Diplodia corticola]OJD35117.1 conserved fungal protein [Diplodia corticola]